jgi:hypothetical protein
MDPKFKPFKLPEKARFSFYTPKLAVISEKIAF